MTHLRLFGVSGRKGLLIGLLLGLAVGAVLVYAGIDIGAKGHPTRSEWMAFSGSIIGSGLSVLGALLVFEWQGVTKRAERMRTLRFLLDRFRSSGAALQADEAELNPVPRVEDAQNAYFALRNVAAELRSRSAEIAEIAQMLDSDPIQRHFARLLVPGIGIAAADLAARGGEIVASADRALARLNGRA